MLFTHKDQAITASAFTALQRDYPNVLKRRHSEVQSVEVNRNGIGTDSSYCRPGRVSRQHKFAIS